MDWLQYGPGGLALALFLWLANRVFRHERNCAEQAKKNVDLLNTVNLTITGIGGKIEAMGATTSKLDATVNTLNTTMSGIDRTVAILGERVGGNTPPPQRTHPA